MSIEDTVKAIKTSVVNSDIHESVAKNAKRNIKGADAETEDSSQVELQSENDSEESTDTSGKGVSIPDTAKTATEES